MFFLGWFFLSFAPLHGEFGSFWPQIRILEPAGKVSNPESRSQNGDVCFLMRFFYFDVWVLLKPQWIGPPGCTTL